MNVVAAVVAAVAEPKTHFDVYVMRNILCFFFSNPKWHNYQNKQGLGGVKI